MEVGNEVPIVWYFFLPWIQLMNYKLQVCLRKVAGAGRRSGRDGDAFWAALRGIHGIDL